MAVNWLLFVGLLSASKAGYTDCMANPKVEIRLPPIMHAYLDDLAGIGYGASKVGVARRFVENAIAAALDSKVIATRKAADFGGSSDEEE